MNSQRDYASFQLAIPSSFQPAGSELAPAGSRTARGVSRPVDERTGGLQRGVSVGWVVVTPPTKASLQAGVAPHASFLLRLDVFPKQLGRLWLEAIRRWRRKGLFILLEEQQPKCAKCVRDRAGDPASGVVSVASPVGHGSVGLCGRLCGEGGVRLAALMSVMSDK